MKEGAGHVAADRAGFGHRVAVGIGHLRQGRIGLVEDGGVVEFVAPERGAGGVAGKGRVEYRAAVAEVELAFLVAGDEAEEAGHLVAGALLVDERVAQGHVAAAFAVDGFRFRVAAEGGAEGFGGGEAARVEFGVAAGKPDEIGRCVGRFVGEGRERQDFRPCRAPAFEKVGIGEGKRLVPRERRN